MAVLIAGGGSFGLGGSASVTADSTAQARYVRIAIFNADNIQHTYQVRFGTQQIKLVTLQPNEDRIVGPHALTNAETVVAICVEASTTASTWRVTGEY